ncbi:MAG: glycosyltransferase [Chloroflexi bacterium]|nr:glycosyltransferase [Chloroflexota bacterium]
MKLVVIGPVYPYRGGIAHFTTLLSRALAQKYPVQVISFKRQYPSFLYPGESDRDPSLEPLEISARYLLDPLYPWTWQQAIGAVARYQAEAVLTQWWTTFWAPAFAWVASGLRRRGVPVIYLVHNVLPHEPRRWDAPLARLALRQGSAFIVQNRREGERLAALAPGVRYQICHHPNYEMFASQKIPKGEACRLLRLPADQPVLLFFGIVRPYKGLRVLLEAAARLKERGENLYLVVAGEFWEDPDDYRLLIDKLGLAGQVHLENRYIPNEEVGRYFSAADLFVAPYIQGTQSGAVKMALGFGLPVVVSDAVAEGISPTRGQAVKITPAGDAGALAEAISTLLASPQSAAGETPPPVVSSWDEMVGCIEWVLRAGYNFKKVSP